jgi:hypothetical protein
MNAAKVARLGHRWLGLIIGIQVLLWTASGLYMVAVDLDFIHGDSLVRNVAPAFDLRAAQVPLARLRDTTPEGIETLRLRALPDGQLVYELGAGGRTRLIDAGTGATLAPRSQEHIVELARLYYAGTGEPRSATLIDQEAERPGEIPARRLPVWRVDFDDGLQTSLYLHPDTGGLVTRRHRFWRWFDFLWSLHIMDYRERTDTNNGLLRAATLLGLPLALFGLWLAFYSFPFLARWRTRRHRP